jgi:hypothetical protein
MLTKIERDTTAMRRSRRNVTVDPLSQAVPAHDLQIEQVLNLETGEHLDVREWISVWRYEQIILQRLEIRENLHKSPRFCCGMCHVPVYLVSNHHKRFFFKHLFHDGTCDARTWEKLTRQEILAKKYHGLPESEPHRRIKALVTESLLADPRYVRPAVERRFSSVYDSARWRRPDVRTTGPMGSLAFEVQLSTTFLDVVVARRAFYLQERVLLVWIMGDFDPSYRRMTTDDLLFSNNSNILVVDKETAACSQAVGRFIVRCHFRRPTRDGDSIADIWDSCLMPFDELTVEPKLQRCWYFDYEGEADSIRAAIEEDLRAREKAALDALRERIFSFWIGQNWNEPLDEAAQLLWAELCAACDTQKISLPLTPRADFKFVALMNAVTSAKEGRPIGSNLKQLIEVGHLIAEHYPRHVAAFSFALRHFDTAELLKNQDRSAKWEKRREKIRASLDLGEQTFTPDEETFPLIRLLMPGVEAKLERLLAKASL